MADLVNPTHKSALSQRNSEPTHLSGGHDTIGGPGVDSVPGGDDYKLDVTRGISTDTSIPRAVSAEPTHRSEIKEDDDELDIDFGEDAGVVDDLDKELDEFEDIDPVDLDVAIDDDEFTEETEKDDEKAIDEGENPFAKDDDEKKLDEEDEDEDELKESRRARRLRREQRRLRREEAENDDEKKLDEEDDEDDEKKELTEEDEDDEKKELTEEDEDDEKKLDEEDEDKDEDEVKSESIKIRIKLPSAQLFESAGLGARTQKKVATIFESIIKDTTKQVSGQLHAHYKRLHEQKLAKRDAVLAKQVDSYLSYVAEEWVKSNRVQIRQSLRAEFAEEFLNGLQRLFKEHYVDVPASRRNVLDEMSKRINKLQKSLNEQVAQKLRLRKLAESANKARIVAEFSRNLSEAQAAKLMKLAEDTDYTNARDFREKLTMLRESYFPQAKPELQTLGESVITVEDEANKPRKASSGDPVVNAIAATLSNQSKASKW
jgi:hypothetical protein